MDNETAQATEKLIKKDFIQVLLAEYNTLRSEIIARMGYCFQVVAIFVASITWSLKEINERNDWYLYSWISLTFIMAALMLYVNIQFIWRIAERLRMIERDINIRAGEAILVWESKWGSGTDSFDKALLGPKSPTPNE